MTSNNMLLHCLLYRTQQKQLLLVRRSILPLQPPRTLTNVTATIVDRSFVSSSLLLRTRSVVSSSSLPSTTKYKSIICCSSRTPPIPPTTTTATTTTRIWNRRFATNDDSLNSNTSSGTAVVKEEGLPPPPFTATATTAATVVVTNVALHSDTAAPTLGNSAAADTLRSYIQQIKNRPDYNNANTIAENEHAATAFNEIISTFVSGNKRTANTVMTTPPTSIQPAATAGTSTTTATSGRNDTISTTGTSGRTDIVRSTAASDSTTPFVTATKKSPSAHSPPKLRSNSQFLIKIVQTADQLVQLPVGAFVYPDDYNSSSKCIRRICTELYSDRKQKFDYLHEIDASFFISAINISLQLLERNVEEYSLLQTIRQSNSTTGTHEMATKRNNDTITDPTSLAAIFSKKINIKRDDMTLPWFCNERSINNLFSRWTYLVSILRPNNALLIKNPSGNNTKLPELVSAQELIQSLKRMSNSVPSPFRCDITSIQMILKVLIQQVPSKQEAPGFAEQLLSLVNINADNKSNIISLAHAYAIVMNAWVDSGLPEVGAKMDALLQEFQTIGKKIDASNKKSDAAYYPNDDHEQVSTRLIPYFIVMRYHAVNKNFKKGIDILEGSSSNNNNDDNKRHFNPSASCEFLSFALYCAIQLHEIQYMGPIFQRSVEAFKTTDQNNSKRFAVQQEFFLVGTGHMLNYYCSQIRMIIENNTYRNIHHQDEDSTATIKEYIDRGKYVYQFVKQFCSPSGGETSSHMHVGSKMMEIYGFAKEIDLVKDIFHKMVAPDREAHDMLIKAYGNCHLPDQAEKIFKKMFTTESRVKPTSKTIYQYMNCWVESMSSDDVDKTAALEKIYHIFRWMKTDKQCTDRDIQPNSYIFFVLLKGEVASATSALILSESNDGKNSNILQINNSIVEKVGSILTEMEDRYKGGDQQCKPNVDIYSIAMKALILANDYLCAEQLLHHMEESIYRNKNLALPNASTRRPSVEIYIIFFNFYTRMRSTDGATRSEQLHNHMRNLSIEMADEEIKPNSITYNKVLDAWVASGDTNVTTDLWRIYEQMSKVDNITIEHDTYRILIKSISKSNRDQDKKRLMELLQHRNDNPTADMDGSLHIIALENCMSSGDVTTTTQILKAIIDSYVQGHFTIVPPDRSTFNWILTTYLESNDLKSATLFVQDIVQMKNNSKHDSSGNELDVSWIGPDFNLILDLRKAWEEDTKDAAKHHFTSKLDIDLIPTMV